MTPRRYRGVILFTFYRNILLITKPQAVFLHIRRALVQSPPGIVLQIREEGVRAAIGGNSCHIDPIAQRQEHPIDALATNDPAVLIGSQQCLRRRVDDLGPFCREAPLPGQDNIAPVRQAPPARQGLERPAAHEDRMPGGQLLEPLEVGGQVEQQGVVPADSPLLIHGDDGIHGAPSLNGHRDLVLEGLGSYPSNEKLSRVN